MSLTPSLFCYIVLVLSNSLTCQFVYSSTPKLLQNSLYPLFHVRDIVYSADEIYYPNT